MEGFQELLLLVLSDASVKVIILRLYNRLGGLMHTDYSFGCPVDMGASWLHGVCNENSLTPLIRALGLRLYRTSGDNSVLCDYDLKTYAFFDKDGNQVSQQLIIEVGQIFEKILKETKKVRDGHPYDISVLQAILIVLDTHPELRQEGLAHTVFSIVFMQNGSMVCYRCVYDLSQNMGSRACSHWWPRTYGARQRKILPVATDSVEDLVSCWGTDPDSLGAHTCNLVGKQADLCERLVAHVDNIFFAGEATSIDHSGFVHGAYSSGLIAVEDCRRHMLMQYDILDLVKIVMREVMVSSSGSDEALV